MKQCCSKRNIKNNPKYENAIAQYNEQQTEANFQMMMRAQEAMDTQGAWDYSAEIKTILSKLGIVETSKMLANYLVVSKNVLAWLKL